MRAEFAQLTRLRKDDARQHEDDRAHWLAAKAELEAEMLANGERLQDLERQLEDSRQQHAADAGQRVHFESQIKDLTDSLGHLTEQLDTEREEFKSQRHEWSERREQLAAKLVEIETKLATTENELSNTEQLADRVKDHAAERERWEQERQELARQLADAEQTRLRQETDVEILNVRCTEFQTRVRELENQLEELKQKADAESQVEVPSPDELQKTRHGIKGNARSGWLSGNGSKQKSTRISGKSSSSKSRSTQSSRATLQRANDGTRSEGGLPNSWNSSSGSRSIRVQIRTTKARTIANRERIRNRCRASR